MLKDGVFPGDGAMFNPRLAAEGRFAAGPRVSGSRVQVKCKLLIIFDVRVKVSPIVTAWTIMSIPVRVV
jgi:hypothetical protein